MISLFINPFSQKAKAIVKNSGDLEKIPARDHSLLDVVKRTPLQSVDDDSKIPTNLKELSIKRVEWYLKKRNSDNYNQRDYMFLFNPEITKFDILSFYMAAQAIGLKFNPNSRESRVFVESEGELVEERLRLLDTKKKAEISLNVIKDLIGDETPHWAELGPLLMTGKIKLSELLLDNGEVILSADEFISRFSDKIGRRKPHIFHRILEGLREHIIPHLIMQKTKEYLRKVHEMSSNIQPHPLLVDIAEDIADKINREFTPRGPSRVMKASRLNFDAFPPCIKKTLAGVKAGNRNDAIVLLLTSFLSYARLYPSIFKERRQHKISDFDPHLDITLNEILPIIYEAADKCEPPLFEDDPQEKLNITSKLGFGLHETPELGNEGESKWYTPMSCEKIQVHLPHLCKPDKTCERISNPLSYYNKRRWELREKG